MELTGNLTLSRCPHCSLASPLLKLREIFETTDQANRNARTWGTYICSSCGGVVTAWATRGSHTVRDSFPKMRSISDDIPETAKAYLQQASESLHAPAGAVMLSASAVDAMLKSKGLTNGSLYTRINTSAEQHIITEDMATWAHDVRLDANDQRHADQNASLPTTIDAQRVLDFSMALAEILYVLPSKVARGIAQAESSNG
ncbi:DUF4145 domain-containing protein [Vibrio alginolyticus]|nr:DUF4145 domain-containing protein [Vibrio alginolyticus]MCR9612293.1 DUF4145 domain-containing protein [Vibrio alginolyticus]